MLYSVKRQLEPLNRREHRDSRGDHAVPVEKCRTEEAKQNEYFTHSRIGGCRPTGQCRQRHDPAFTLVVGAQNEQHVLDRDHPDQRPEDQRQNAQHAIVVGLDTVVTGKHFL
ncbi:hypothetical protein D3C76_339590 [compost metagenome]